MWKDYFYFSKGQRSGIIILICLILFVIVLNTLLPLFYKKTEPAINQDFLTEVQEFNRSLVLRDSLWKQKYEQNYQNRYRNYPLLTQQNNRENYSLFGFNPNTADSVTFIKLGLKPYVASNIIRFRKKGGSFKTTDSFSKVYGLSSEKFNELEPYIEITDNKSANIDSTKLVVEKKVQNMLVELNSADTTELMKIRGIGRFLAKGIVRLRDQLGGFVSVEQVREVYGMKDENFDKIKSSLKVNTTNIRKTNVNIASVEKLNAHPYLNFYQSKAIYELRRKKGKLKNCDELLSLSELNAETIEKIKPYLVFE